MELPLPPSPLAEFDLAMPHLSQEPTSYADWQSLDSQNDSEPTQITVSPRLHRHSWSYYISDIALKQLECRSLNALYRGGPEQWTLDLIPTLLCTVRGFESELDAL